MPEHPGDKPSRDSSPQQVHEIAEQFEHAWRHALEGGPIPELEPRLARVTDEDRPELQADLQRIENLYRSQLDGANDESEKTTNNAAGATVDLPPNANPNSSQLDGANDESEKTTSNAAGATVDLPPSAHPNSSQLDGANDESEKTTSNAAGATVDLPPNADSPKDAQEREQPKAFEATLDTSHSLNAFEQTLDSSQGAREFEPTLGVSAPSTDGTSETLDLSPDSLVTPVGMQRVTRRELPKIPGYEIDGELGRGAMGVVYKARQKGLNRTVALKMILAGGHAGPEHLARFHAEAEAVAQLQHPGIVQIHDVGDQDGMPYFSLEFVNGKPLDEEIKGKPVTPRRAAELVEKISRAMNFAHEHNIVHRDLKPANILLTREGLPKVSDFGLVKKLADDSGQTRTGTILGTPSYMAPEQARGEKAVGAPADIYGLGAVLYCLLTGRPPFAAATALDTVMQVIDDEPVTPTLLQPKIPADLETVCMKCLQKETVKRYATAGELADDLERYLNGEPIQARAVTTFERAWRWCRRNPRVAILSTAASFLALVLMTGGPAAAVVLYRLKGQADTQRSIAEVNERNAEKSAREARRQEGIAAANARTAEQNAEEANDQRGIAEENARLAKESEKQAKEAEKRALDSAKIAADERALALKSLETLVFEAQRAIGRQPKMQQLRTRLLEVALQGLNLREQENERLTGRMKAGAHRRLANVFLEMGQIEKAREQIEKCKQAVEETHAAGKLTKANANFGILSENTGDIVKSGGDKAGARTYYEKALGYFRAWEKEDGLSDRDRAFIRHNVANLYGKLGEVSFLLGDAGEGQSYFERGFKIRKEWADANPGNSSAQRELAGAFTSISDVSLRLGDMEEAKRELNEAVRILTELAAANKNDQTLPWNVALRYLRLGNIELMATNAKSAKEHYTTSLSILEPLHKSNRKDAQLRGNVAQGLYGLGVACRELGEQEADGYFDRSRRLRELLVADDEYSSSRKTTLMLTLARCGQHQLAVELSDELAEHSPDDPFVLFMVACGRSLAAEAVERTGGSPISDMDATLRDEYYTRAFESLEAAIAHGYQDAAFLRLDPDLAPLRARGMSQFESLMEKLAQQSAFEAPPSPELTITTEPATDSN